MVESIQVAKISASSIVVYNKVLDQRPRSDRQIENEINLRDQEYNGFMSPKTKCKVRKMLDAWMTAVELERKKLRKGLYWRNSKITFVTLTLSAGQFHDDNYIKRNMLNRFIIEAKREWDVYNYFWRAEPQKNGNIHFHLIMDKFIPWRELRDKWNAIQEDHGYIEKFKAKFLHCDANSTDVHGLDEIKNVGAYLIKYCCKITGSRKIAGRIWGSSDSLKNINAYEVEMSNEVIKYIEKVESLGSSKVIVKEDFTLIFTDNEKNLCQFVPNLFRDWKIHYSKIFSSLYTLEGRKKVEAEIEMQKRQQAYSAQLSEVQKMNSSSALVSSQLSLFVPSQTVHSR